MLHIRASARRAILRVRFVDRIHAEDFRERAAPAAEALRARHGRIELLVLDLRRFDGWGALGAFAEQIRFLRRHGRAIARVALLGNRAWSGAVPAVSALFVAAEVRAFTPAEGARLREWLRECAPLSPRARSGSAERSSA